MFATRTMTKTCPYCAEEIQAEALKCKHCLSWVESGPHGGPNGFGAFGRGKTSARLLRSSSDRMVWGVCGGIARLLGVDATLVRVAYALGSLFTALLPGIAIYLILGFIIPSDDDPRGMV